MASQSPIVDTGTILDARVIAAMRLVLAVFALLILYSSSAVPLQPVTLLALGLYIFYGAVFYVLTLRRSVFVVPMHRWPFWTDVVWYVLLTMLTGGATSVFYYFFYFAILVSSFQFGASSGLQVATASVFGFAGAAVIAAYGTPGGGIDLSLFVPRTSYLLLLGYLVAYWGGHEVTLKRRLLLLKEITTLSNPRFGIDRTIGSLMEQIRTFYDADACLWVSVERATDEYYLRRADRSDPERGLHAEPLVPALAKQLLALPDGLAVTYSSEERSWWRLRPSYHAVDLTQQRTHVGRETSAKIATLLDAESFASVPVRYRHTSSGRLFLIAERRTFNDSDVDFLVQIVEHVAPIVDNIRLVDQLASSAAEAERQRIARDLHDSVIQPYIGLQMGLNAAREQAESGEDVADAIDRLIQTTQTEIADLRRYVHGLKEAGEHRDNLVPAVKRFARKFTEATGIDVAVNVEDEFAVSGRAAAEAFQIVVEGLSNVRKHTHARDATVTLARTNDTLVMQIENEVADGDPPESFTPRSISERAASLGGRARVEQREDATTVVSVSIPL